LAFHCTNLHPAEIAGVLAGGLVPLDTGLVVRRVKARVAAGDIPQSIAAKLQTDCMANEGNRAGMLWVIFTRSTLKRWGDVYRLLSYWGGEALYGPHEDDPVVAELLAKVGRPAIVEVSVPVSRVECALSVGERLLIRYLSRRRVGTAHEPEFEGYVKRRIVGRRIRRVIGVDDSEFVKLIGRRFEAPDPPVPRRKLRLQLISSPSDA
jgi:hypothetical protein